MQDSRPTTAPRLSRGERTEGTGPCLWGAQSLGDRGIGGRVLGRGAPWVLREMRHIPRRQRMALAMLGGSDSKVGGYSREAMVKGLEQSRKAPCGRPKGF